MISNLTILDITKPDELKVEYNGRTIDPGGQERKGFDVVFRETDSFEIKTEQEAEFIVIESPINQ